MARTRKRILFIDHTANLGGGEIALLNLVTHLDQTRYDPMVLLFSEGPLAARLRDAQISTHIINLAPDVATTKKDSLGIRTLLRVPQILRSIAFTWKVSQFIRGNDVDIVHTNSLKADILGGVAAKLARRPLVWHVRDRIERDYLPLPVVHLFRQLCDLLPDFVIANSQATLDTLNLGRGEHGTAIASGVDLRARVAHDGMNTEHGLNPSGSIANSERTVGLIGRISRWKGQHVFLEAAAEVHKQFPTVRFQIIGAPLFDEQDYEREIHELVDRLGIRDFVEFTGFREDVPRVIQKLEIVVHASITAEPFGQVVTEGMLASKPVIATAAGGVLEIVVDSVTGLLVPMNDAASMAEAICYLLRNPELAKKMGHAGRNRVLQSFTIEQTIARVESVYDEILATSRRELHKRLPRQKRLGAMFGSVALVVMAFLIVEWLHRYLGDRTPISAIFLLVIVFSIRVFGMGAGLLATAGSLIGAAYILPMSNSFIVERAYLPTLLLLAATALLITPLVGSLKMAELRARAAQAAAEKARTDTDYLSRASAALALASDTDGVVQSLIQLSNSRLSDTCIVDLIDGGEIVHWIGGTGKEAGRHAKRESLDYVASPRVSEHPAMRSIRTRHAVWFDSDDLQEAPKWSSEDSGGHDCVHSAISIPICLADRTLGAISLYRSKNLQPFRSADLTLASELAGRAAAVLAQFQAVYNAQSITSNLEVVPGA